MTSLLLGTFLVGGIHTLLWLPRALHMKRAHRKRQEEKEEKSKNGNTKDA
jgi:hypothetical protein